MIGAFAALGVVLVFVAVLILAPAPEARLRGYVWRGRRAARRSATPPQEEDEERGDAPTRGGPSEHINSELGTAGVIFARARARLLGPPVHECTDAEAERIAQESARPLVTYFEKSKRQ
jgi:hypothetical protein